VLPVAPPAEKSGSYLDWEGRTRRFATALASNAMSDYRVLDALADQLGSELGLRGVERVRAELAELGRWEGTRTEPPTVPAAEPPAPRPGTAVLATWRLLLDAGRMQDGEPYLAGTAHRAVARMSAATAAEAGVSDSVRVSTAHGSLTLPVAITPMPDRVVWLPQHSQASRVHPTLGVTGGAVVTIDGGEPG